MNVAVRGTFLTSHSVTLVDQVFEMTSKYSDKNVTHVLQALGAHDVQLVRSHARLLKLNICTHVMGIYMP